MSMIACYQMADVKMINELLEKSAEEVVETIEEKDNKRKFVRRNNKCQHILICH